MNPLQEQIDHGLLCCCLTCNVSFMDRMQAIWDGFADRAESQEFREHCEDEAWLCARTAEAYRRDAARTAKRKAQTP